MVNEGIALNAGLDSKASIYDNTSTEQQNGSSSSEHVVDVERVRVDKVVSDVKNAGVRPSCDNNTLNEEHHLNNDTFENVFALEIHNHEQLEVENCKKGLGFENKNDVENPFVLSKAKELTPSLYNIDEIGKDLFSDDEIISEEEFECKVEKRLKVKQRKSPLSYHSFLYGEIQFEEL
ncbi:hypothetical protein Tco_0904705 [Tanacetum coccineum]